MGVEHDIAAWRLACERGVPFAFRGLGLSMWPSLRPGDEALFAPLDAPPAPRAVLLYRAGDQLVAHRFLGVLPDGRLRLRGDAMAADDPPVEPAAVLGHLIGLRRGGRTLPPPRIAPLLRGVTRRMVRVVRALTPPGVAGSVGPTGDGRCRR